MLTASASGLYIFAAQYPTPPILYLRFTASLAVAVQDSRPSGSLLLSCKALSSSTFMPVYPGALTSPLYSSAAARLMGKCPLSNLLMFFIRADSDASRSLRPPYLIVNITLLEVSLGVLLPPP